MADAGYDGEVRCRCGRTRQPSEMLEVRTLGVGEAFLCVPCVEDLFRKNIVDQLTFHRRAGASQEWLAWYEAKLLRGPLHRSGLPPEIWGEMLARTLDAKLQRERGG
jgi:hypothetical protein